MTYGRQLKSNGLIWECQTGIMMLMSWRIALLCWYL